MRVDGRCHCGAITYQAEVEPDRVVICHCTDCQTLSGSAFRVVVQARPGSFRLLSGAPRIYLKRAESGREREQAFCPDCGAPIYSAPPGDNSRAVALRVGTIRQRNLLVPRVQFWSRSSRGWLADLAGIRKLETQPGFERDGTFDG